MNVCIWLSEAEQTCMGFQDGDDTLLRYLSDKMLTLHWEEGPGIIKKACALELDQGLNLKNAINTDLLINCARFVTFITPNFFYLRELS